MGRRARERQRLLWIAADEGAAGPPHVFNDRLNRLLGEGGFDDLVETLGEPIYCEGVGRDSIPTGVYFRMLLVGDFEGLGSQRGIAWRCSDSFSLRRFLGCEQNESPPDHSSLTRIRDAGIAPAPAARTRLKPRRLCGGPEGDGDTSPGHAAVP